MNFNNTEVAFLGKSNADLKRSYWLFKIIGWRWLIRIGPLLLRLFLPFKFPIPIIKSTIFRQFCGGESIDDCERAIHELGLYNIKTILDYSVEGKKEEETFDANLLEILDTIQKASKNEHIPFSVFKPTGLGRFELLEKINDGKPLSSIEETEFERVKQRIDTVCAKALELDVPVFIDAEETWIQNPIDDIAINMMRKYNSKKAIVYNTAQLYRKDRLIYLKEITEKAKKEDFIVGMKLVRGAYIEQERDRAKRYGYDDPMQVNKSDTDRDFNLALEFCIENIERVSFCCASHNEESTSILVELMKRYRIEINDPRIYFSQLLGMSDHISKNMSKAGFNVAKYVPYGPVKDVTPYLIRRAEENTSIAGQRGRELTLIVKEQQRRKTT